MLICLSCCWTRNHHLRSASSFLGRSGVVRFWMEWSSKHGRLLSMALKVAKLARTTMMKAHLHLSHCCVRSRVSSNKNERVKSDRSELLTCREDFDEGCSDYRRFCPFHNMNKVIWLRLRTYLHYCSSSHLLHLLSHHSITRWRCFLNYSYRIYLRIQTNEKKKTFSFNWSLPSIVNRSWKHN